MAVTGVDIVTDLCSQVGLEAKVFGADLVKFMGQNRSMRKIPTMMKLR